MYSTVALLLELSQFLCDLMNVLISGAGECVNIHRGIFIKWILLPYTHWVVCLFLDMCVLKSVCQCVRIY